MLNHIYVRWRVDMICVLSHLHVHFPLRKCWFVGLSQVRWSKWYSLWVNSMVCNSCKSWLCVIHSVLPGAIHWLLLQFSQAVHWSSPFFALVRVHCNIFMVSMSNALKIVAWSRSVIVNEFSDVVKASKARLPYAPLPIGKRMQFCNIVRDVGRVATNCTCQAFLLFPEREYCQNSLCL